MRELANQGENGPKPNIKYDDFRNPQKTITTKKPGIFAGGP